MRARLLLSTLLAAVADGRAQDGAPAALAKARAYLIEHVDRDDWLRGTTSNARGQRVVAQAMLAFTLAATAHEDLREPGDRVAARADATLCAAGVEDFGFATWLSSSVSFAAAERWLRDGHAPAVTPELVDRIAELRNSEGVWAHGQMEGLVGFYPSSLMAATNWALFALGFGRSAGHAPPADTIEHALEVLCDVQAENGGVPYGGRPYRLGVEAGRTAGTVLALLSLGRSDGDAFAGAARFVRHNLRLVPEGHASPAMHVFNGALCAWALGPATWRRYRELVLQRLLDAQRDDGSFEDIIGERSPDSMAIMGDPISSRAYVTALYTAALAVPTSRLGAWLRERAAAAGDGDRLDALAVEPPPLQQVWQLDVAGATGLGQRDGTVFVFDADGWQTLRATDGRPLGSQRARWRGEDGRKLLVGEHVVAFDPAAGELAVTASDTGERRWHARAGTVPQPDLGLTDDALVLLQAGGALVRFELETGARNTIVDLGSTGMRNMICPLPDGACIVTCDERIACYEADGTRRWRGRNRDPIARVSATWLSLARAGDTFVGGSSDGSVIARRLDDGTAVWRAVVRNAAGQVLVDPRRPDRVVVVDAASVVSRIVAGRIVWQIDVSGMRQAPEGTATYARLGEDRIWVAVPGRERLVEVDFDGRVLGATELGEHDDWLVAGSCVVRRRGDTLTCFAATP